MRRVRSDIGLSKRHKAARKLSVPWGRNVGQTLSVVDIDASGRAPNHALEAGACGRGALRARSACYLVASIGATFSLARTIVHAPQAQPPMNATRDSVKNMRPIWRHTFERCNRAFPSASSAVAESIRSFCKGVPD